MPRNNLNITTRRDEPRILSYGFRCPHCGRVCKTVSGLQKHTAALHSAVEPEPDSEPSAADPDELEGNTVESQSGSNPTAESPASNRDRRLRSSESERSSSTRNGRDAEVDEGLDYDGGMDFDFEDPV
ncbi:hypothetical protein SCHPADRAFT_993813 [Schizopora paradoxa]|uniref:C2H2-type domain-containing protein n=1 Tax=Schizopora paradoxa TaxID=27342 RepID=A0A0H2S0Z7_9AGAM|nr:hypothetical protein SCHPADRAFT_993813 [Schizopora paradoxa]